MSWPAIVIAIVCIFAALFVDPIILLVAMVIIAGDLIYR